MAGIAVFISIAFKVPGMQIIMFSNPRQLMSAHETDSPTLDVLKSTYLPVAQLG